MCLQRRGIRLVPKCQRAIQSGKGRRGTLMWGVRISRLRCESV